MAMSGQRFPDTAGEVKVVNVVDNKATDHTVLMTKVDGGGYPPLDDKGFGGEFIFFQVVDAGVVAAHYDPRKLRMEAPFVGRNDVSYEFMVALHDGAISWGEVPNGEEIDPRRLEGLVNG
jgi:hypothetical protein